MVISITKAYSLIGEEFQTITRKALQGWKHNPRTEKQEKMLHRLNLGYSEVRYKGDACKVISKFLERETKGLAKIPTLIELHELGYRNIAEYTEQKARFFIRNSHVRNLDIEFLGIFTYPHGKIAATSYEDAVKAFCWLKAKYHAKDIKFQLK